MKRRIAGLIVAVLLAGCASGVEPLPGQLEAYVGLNAPTDAADNGRQDPNRSNTPASNAPEANAPAGADADAAGDNAPADGS